jgi:hypothetical protein
MTVSLVAAGVGPARCNSAVAATAIEKLGDESGSSVQNQQNRRRRGRRREEARRRGATICGRCGAAAPEAPAAPGAPGPRPAAAADASSNGDADAGEKRTGTARVAWTAEERARLFAMVERDGKGDWAGKAVRLGTGRKAKAVEQVYFKNISKVQAKRVGGPTRVRIDQAELAMGDTTLSFHTVTDCHWLPSLMDLHSNLAVTAVIVCSNDRLAHG